MMGSENPGFEESHLFASREEMENLVLDDPLTTTTTTATNNNNSYSSFRSAKSSISDASTRHPLSPPVLSTPAESDPLLAPPVFRNPNASDNNSYIEPPSYADVIFSPFDDNSANEINRVDSTSPDLDSSLTLSRSSSSTSDYIKITVSNPKKEQETSNSLVPGGNTYYTYLITTRTNIADFGSSEFSVRRRFRDVVTLSDRLAESYRGYFIPPRPDKNVVESQVMQKQEFVEQRRVALEKYLRRLAEHPVIRQSDELKVFLQVEGRLPLSMSTDVASRMLDGAVKLPKQLFGESTAVVAPHEVVQPAKGGRDLLRLFKELRQSVANDWGGSKPPVVEEDKVFLEKKEWIHDLEQQISNASQQAESLVKAQQDMGETMGELGLAFIKLTKFENEEAMYNSQRVRAADMKCLATAAVKASRFYRELNAQTVKHLVMCMARVLATRRSMAQIRRMDCKVEVKSSADRFFDAFNTKAHLMPKMSTRLISDVKLLQGDWNSLGSVRMWYYASQGKSAACKEVRENVDEKNRTIVYGILEGEISNYYKTWKSTLNVTPNGEGSLAKWTIKYEKQNDHVPEPLNYCDFYAIWSKDVDAYLLSAK